MKKLLTGFFIGGTGWIECNKTLRDEFAMSALSGLLLRDEISGRHPYDIDITSNYADWAYCYADAMMKARENKNG